MKRLALAGFLFSCLSTGSVSAFADESCVDGDGFHRSGFHGEVLQTEIYTHGFGSEHSLVLQPVEFGWDIVVVDATGTPLNVIVPASGIPRENPRVLLGRHFLDDMQGDRAGGPSAYRRIAFGLEATDPERTIAPGVPGVPGAAATPYFGQVELEVLEFDVEAAAEGPAPRLTRLRFSGCVEWSTPTETSVLNGTTIDGHDDVGFPGFDPEEQVLQHAMIHVSAMTDQLDLATAGDIDAETASARIEAVRNALRETRASWREADPKQRIQARADLRADLERFGERLNRAIESYEASEYRDYGLIQRLRTPPDLADFLREPPIETFHGLYRSGFEASDFYPLEGGTGPWWLETTEDNWETLQSYLIQRPGRGSSVTVGLTVTGWRETAGEGDYGSLGAYETLLHVETIEAIRALTQEEFDLVANPEP